MAPGSSGAFTLPGVPRGSLWLRGQIWDGILSSVQDQSVELAGATLAADVYVPVGHLAARDTQLWELDVPAGATLSAGVQGWAVGAAPCWRPTRVEIFSPDGRLEGQEDGSGSARAIRLLTNVAAGTWLVAARSTTDVAGGYRVGSTLRDLTHVFRPYLGGMVEVAVTRGPLALNGLDVTLENSRADLPAGERQRTSATDAQGGYRVPMRSGPITASVVDPASGETYTASGELAADGTLRLAIDLPLRPTTLTGFVTNGDGQTGLPAYVEMYRSGSYVASTSAAADGSYRFDDLAPGEYTLWASFVGPPAEATIELTGGTATLNLTIPISVVRGVVQEPPPDGGGAPGVQVELCFAANCYNTVTDAFGSFAFYGLDGAPPAFLRATIQDGSGVTTGAVPIPWTEGFIGTVVQPLVLPESARLFVTVKDADDNLVGNAAVRVYEDGPGGALLRQGYADESGVFRARFSDVGSDPRVRGEWLAGRPGEERGTLTIGAELPLEVHLAATGTVDVAIVDEGGGWECGYARLQSIEQPGADGGVWTRFLNLCPEGPSSQSVQAPVGPYRVFILDTDTPGAVEGELAKDDYHEVRLRYGTHVRLPRPLPGDEALFVGDASCPPPCSGFAHTQLDGAMEDYPPIATPEAEGRSLRGLQVAAPGVRARRVQYAPPSGAFGRTLTLVTNPGTAPVTVALDSELRLEDAPGSATTPGGGDVGPGEAWAVVGHSGGLQGLVLGSAVAPDAFDLLGDSETPSRFTARHTLELNQGETKALLTFTLVGTGSDTAPLAARAAAIEALAEPGAFFGLTNEERHAIVNFAVPPAGDARVWVAIGDDAIVGARVGVIDGSGRLVAQSTTTGPDGTAFFAGLAPGSYTIVAVDDSGRPGRAVVDVSAGTTVADTLDVDVELLADEALGSIDVAAAWAGSGDPAESQLLALEADGWSPLWRPTAFTDENGLVSFSLVPPGLVRVQPDPEVVGAAGSVTVSAGAVAPAPLTLEPFATLTGQVTAGDGSTPVANAPVVAVDAADASVLASGRTDAAGSYRLHLRPGTSGVLVRAASPYDAGVTVESELLTPPVPGTTGVPTLALPVGVIQGSVSRASGNVPHPVVVAWDSSGRSLLAEWTDEWGNFRIVGVAAGPVTIVVIDPADGERASESIEIDTGSPYSLWVWMGPTPS